MDQPNKLISDPALAQAATKPFSKPNPTSPPGGRPEKSPRDPARADRIIRRLIYLVSFLGIGALLYINAVYYFLNPDTRAGGWLAGVLYITLAILVFCGMLAYGVIFFIRTFFWRDTPPIDKLCYAIAFILPTAAMYFGITGTNWTDIDGEGTFQMGLGLKFLREDPNFGIYNVAYVTGYVARQYVLAALPSYFFSPGLITLRIGNSYFYTVGYLALLASLAGYLKARQAERPLLLAAFAGAMFSLSTYPLLYGRLFEQTTMPIGAACGFLAALFCYLMDAGNPARRFGGLKLFWLTWSVGFCADGYTPALAVGILAVCLLLYLIFIPRFNYPLFFIPVAHGIASVILANTMLHHFNAASKFILGPSDIVFSDWVWRYFNSAYSLFSSERTLISYPLALALALTLYYSWKWRDVRVPLICLWSLSVVWSSVSIMGSYFDSPIKEIHRSMIILPFLAAAVVLFYHRYRERITPPIHGVLQTFAVIGIFFISYTSLITACTHNDNTYIDMDYNEALEKISILTHDHAQPTPYRLYLAPPLTVAGLEDALTYFIPAGIKVIRAMPPEGARDPHTYVLAYKTTNPNDRGWDCIVPSRHPRPYMRMVPEKDWVTPH
jgi:hypothetical protein